MEKLAKAMETRGFLISHTPDSIYFRQGNTRDELHLMERMFKEIGCDVEIKGRNIRIRKPLTEKQVQRIIWYPARNHEAGADYRSDSWKYFAKRRHGAKVNTFVLETGVALLVKALSSAGISTFCSCDGHGKRSPSIIFSGHKQAIWFDLLFPEIKKALELNYKWEINWKSRMGPSLMADKISESQKWNLPEILEDTMKIAHFILENAEELSTRKRGIFGKRLKATRKIVKTMSDEELYMWMSKKYNQHQNIV